MKKPKTIAIITLVILIIIVLAQNAEAINVNFFFWSFSASAFIMYIIFFIVGIITTVAGIFWRKSSSPKTDDFSN